MALSFAQLSQIPYEQEFQQRVNYALNVAAVNVASESSTVAGHISRYHYAIRVLNGNVDVLAACYAVLTNPTIAAEATLPSSGQPPAGNNIPDGDIQFAVNSIWTALAGA